MRRVWLAGCVVALGVGLACAQTPASQQNESQWKQTPEGKTTAPPPNMNCTGSASKGNDGKWTTNSNCPAAQDQPVPSSAAQQFPYPGESGSSQQTNSGQQTAPQQTPSAPSAQQAPASPAQQFPYPGEQPEGTSSSGSSGTGDVKPAPPGGLNDAGSSGSSSSSSQPGYSSSNSDNAPSPDEPDDTSVPKKTRSSRTRPAEPVKTPTQRFSEDLEVAGFYQNIGNFNGAYMRAKDAVSISGDSPDARLALADAARKLGKLDEAEQNYKKCLQLDPVPKTKKAAEVALKEMTGGGS